MEEYIFLIIAQTVYIMTYGTGTTGKEILNLKNIVIDILNYDAKFYAYITRETAAVMNKLDEWRAV